MMPKATKARRKRLGGEPQDYIVDPVAVVYERIALGIGYGALVLFIAWLWWISPLFPWK